MRLAPDDRWHGGAEGGKWAWWPEGDERKVVEEGQTVTAIWAIARLQIHDGKLEEFKAHAAEVLEIVKAQDTGTQQYEFFWNADQTECVVLEQYVDSQALLDHLAHMGDKLAAVNEVAALSGEIYGDPSPELLDALAGIPIEVFTHFQGL